MEVKMADDKATIELRARLREYLQRRGIDPQHGKRFRCLNPAHEDHTPSMTLHKGGLFCRCWTCGQNWSVFDLIGFEFGLTDFGDQKAKAAELFPTGSTPTTKPKTSKPKPGGATADSGSSQPGKPMSRNGNFLTINSKMEVRNMSANQAPPPPPADFSADYEKWHAAVGQTDYWIQRGISSETIERHRLGYNADIKAVVIPCGPSYYVARSTQLTDWRYRNAPGQRVQLFNPEALDQTERPVWIVEGAIDAMSLEQAGAVALGMNSAGMTALVTAAAEKRKTLPPLLIATDRNPAGDAAAEKLLAALTPFTACKRLVLDYCDDANKLLLKMGQDQFSLLIANSENEFQQEIEAGRAEELAVLDQTTFWKHLRAFHSKTRPVFVVPTGFNLLDQRLDGGLRPGLTILGAISGAGKTTFALQIANQVAASGQMVIMFSLEQSINELLAKSISMASNDLTYYDVLDCAADKVDAEPHLLDYIAACDSLYAYGKNLHVLENCRTVSDMSQAVQNIALLTGSVPLVIVDYLQIIQPPGYTPDRRAGIDANVTELKRLAVERGCPVLVISSFNRDSYYKDVSEPAFKESGGIEYSSDLLLGLQYSACEHGDPDLDEEKAREPRRMQVKVIKNRNGSAGSRVNFEFHAKGNRFKCLCRDGGGQ
jgi:replicative DNA helicase